MNKATVEEKDAAMRGKLSQYTSDMLHPVLAACIEARRLRELHQSIAEYNDEMDAKGGWAVFNNPRRLRRESYKYEAEVRLEWILAEDRYRRMADEDEALRRDVWATQDAALANIRGRL